MPCPAAHKQMFLGRIVIEGNTIIGRPACPLMNLIFVLAIALFRRNPG